jgi:hypothetical protein
MSSNAAELISVKPDRKGRGGEQSAGDHMQCDEDGTGADES